MIEMAFSSCQGSVGSSFASGKFRPIQNGARHDSAFAGGGAGVLLRRSALILACLNGTRIRDWAPQFPAQGGEVGRP
jgi:hypothetical protein